VKMRAGCVALLVLLSTVSSCDLGLGTDPYRGIANDACLAGNTRRTGQACVLSSAGIVIDGQAADWEAIASIPLAGTCAGSCDMPLPVALQLATVSREDGERALAWRLVLDRAPPQLDSAVRYAIEFRPLPTWNARSVDAVELSAGVSWYVKSGNPARMVDDPKRPSPWAATWTSDGWEGEAATGLIALRGGVVASARVDRHDGSEWRTQWVSDRARGCWEQDAIKLDPCSPEER